MDTEREPEDEGGRIKQKIVVTDGRRWADRIWLCAYPPFVFNDAPAPPQHQKKDDQDEERVERINFRDCRIRPEGARESEKQTGNKRRQKHHERIARWIVAGANGYLLTLRSSLFPKPALQRREVGTDNH